MSTSHKLFLAFGIALASVIDASAVNAKAAMPPSSRVIYEQNIRDGFSAKAGFELVTFPIMTPRHSGKGAGSSDPNGLPYWKWKTYRLNLHPQNIERYWVGEKGLKHLEWVTLAWKDEKEYPFIFDLYLHGDAHSRNLLAVRIPHLDIRKFLHESTRSFSDDLPLAQLQAYFEEFSRKAKIIFPLSESDDQADQFHSYEKRIQTDLHHRLVDAVAHLQSTGSKGIVALTKAIRLFEREGPLRLDIVDHNLHAAMRDDPSLDLEQFNDMVRNLSIAQKIASIELTNNCREPGIYEVELRDGDGRSMTHANFSFHTKLYNQILTQYHGLGIAEQGTGIRVPREICLQLPTSG
jgi:hypothetical protein